MHSYQNTTHLLPQFHQYSVNNPAQYIPTPFVYYISNQKLLGYWLNCPFFTFLLFIPRNPIYQ